MGYDIGKAARDRGDRIYAEASRRLTKQQAERIARKQVANQIKHDVAWLYGKKK